MLIHCKTKQYIFLDEFLVKFQIFIDKNPFSLLDDIYLETIQSINEDNFQESLKNYLKKCEQRLANKVAASHIEYSKNIWFKLPLWFRAILGGVATLTVLPALLTLCFSPWGYSKTFFADSPAASLEEKSQKWLEASNTYLQEFVTFYKKEEESVPLSRNDMLWDSDEVRTKEWTYAKKQLLKNNLLAPDGTKISRKTHAQHLTHSFMVIGRRIVAVAPKNSSLIDPKDKYSAAKNVKLAEDEHKGSWALKILTKQDQKLPTLFDVCAQDNVHREASVAVDLNMSLPPVQRQKGTFFKTYLPYCYAGITLTKYMELRTYSDEERFDIAIKLAEKLDKLHQGKYAKSQSGYLHFDIHLNNITVDKQGNIHFIDFGLTEVKRVQNKGIYDLNHLSRILSSVIFTEEMKTSYPKLAAYFRNFEAHSSSKLVQDLHDLTGDVYRCPENDEAELIFNY